MTEPKKPISRFVPLSAFKTSLTDNITARDKQLPIAVTPALRTALGADGYTFLTISNMVGTEVVKAYMFDNKILIERGQDGTEARPFPNGSCVDANPTWAGIKAYVCQMDCCEQSE